MRKLRARTKLACEIAHLNPDRFNEAVHSGAFPCAPATRPGAPRSFEVDDIIALRVYAWLMEEGVSAKHAGATACELRNFLMHCPEEVNRAVHVKTSMGSPVWLLPESLPAGATHYDRMDIISTREWHFKYLRQRIVFQLEKKPTPLGASNTGRAQ